MGKNFSCNNVDKKRKKSDFYETPYSLTQLLLNEIRLRGKILEPACGDGAIVRVLEKNNYSVSNAYDINQGKDFLSESDWYDTIITNPPFSLAFEFIQHAKKICSNFIFLLPLAYLHGKKRYDEIYSDKTFPLKKVFVFTRYPMLGEPLREDGKHNTGMMVYAWFWFDMFYRGKGEASIGWLDNNEYILRK